jgi:hypothetical protein
MSINQGNDDVDGNVHEPITLYIECYLNEHSTNDHESLFDENHFNSHMNENKLMKYFNQQVYLNIEQFNEDVNNFTKKENLSYIIKQFYLHHYFTSIMSTNESKDSSTEIINIDFDYLHAEFANWPNIVDQSSNICTNADIMEYMLNHSIPHYYNKII